MKEKPRNIKCILWGGYGWGNVGDELTLAVALHDMQKRFGKSVAILSPVPGYTKALFPEVEIIPYTPKAREQVGRPLPARILKRISRHLNPSPSQYDVEEQLRSERSKGWAEAVKQCELLYLVGGGYLTDLFDVQFYLLPAELARSFGVPVKTAPLGIGPFTHSGNASKLRNALRGAKVRVRDKESQAVCHALGIMADNQRDDGFRVPEVMEINRAYSNNPQLIGVNFYYQHGGSEKEKSMVWWRDLLVELKAGGIPIEGFCFHNCLESDFSQTVQLFVNAGLSAKQVRFPDWDFREGCRGLLNYSAVITSRFHAAVVAGVAGIPTIAVANGDYYGSKMTAACLGLEKSRAVDLNQVQPYQVAEMIGQLVSSGIHA